MKTFDALRYHSHSYFCISFFIFKKKHLDRFLNEFDLIKQKNVTIIDKLTVLQRNGKIK
jgi:hypothetical protein